jgi:parallel beta-helix repeat protein
MSGGTYGVEVSEANDNVIIGNVINHTIWSISLDRSYDNLFYHNDFINKWIDLVHLFTHPGSNYFDNGLEGNYWSDYNGTDNDQDGTGDTPYLIDANNTDRYPLMGTFQSFNLSAWNVGVNLFEQVDVISNISISTLDVIIWLTSPNQYLQPGQPILTITPGHEQNFSTGFCRVTLPNIILNTSNYTALVDLNHISCKKLAASNDTYTTLYLTFNSSALDGIMVIPEFPLLLMLPLFTMMTPLAAAVYRRRMMT